MSPNFNMSYVGGSSRHTLIPHVSLAPYTLYAGWFESACMDTLVLLLSLAI